jgi:RNA polymerase sigma-70 factor (ECF subfamily)
MHKLPEEVADDTLLRLLQQGYKEAFECLFRKYYHPLWRYSLKFVRDSSTAEEIVQEFFIYLWEKRSTHTIPSSVALYFHVAIKNRCFNYLKKKFYQHIPLEGNTDTVYYDPEPLAQEELGRQIEQALEQLPKKCRIIFLLSRQSDLSYKEIAAQLDISVKTVETQMGIALKKLREYLIKHSVNLLVIVGIFCEIFFDAFSG